jgi:general secretion pathway protein D
MRTDEIKHPIRKTALALAAFCLAAATFAADATSGSAPAAASSAPAAAGSDSIPSVGSATLPTLLPVDVPAVPLEDQSGGESPSTSLSGGESPSTSLSGGESTSTSLKPNEFGQTVTSDAVVQYDASTDSVIVITDDKTNENVGRVIKAMDSPVPQALIKVVFVQVTYTNELDYGVEATFQYHQSGSGSTTTPATATTPAATTANMNTLQTAFGVASGLTNNGTSTANGGLYKIIDNDLTAYMRLLQTVGHTEVLSRPSILVRNNEDAKITVGQNMPFITGSTVSDTGVTTNNISYQDIGIILEVQPRITVNGMVQMYVYPQISSISSTKVQVSETFNATVLDKRAAETYVVVPDGKTVVIGGMMQDNHVKSESKLPWLGDIPYLGWLFGTTSNRMEKTELLIFLTPYIVTIPDKMEEQTKIELNRAELPAKAFDQRQFNKFMEKDALGQSTWNNAKKTNAKKKTK